MLYEEINQRLSEQEQWVLRRQLGIPNNRCLFVLTCMDERLPVHQALGITDGDANIFRNAGGVVTDDAIRSAMLATNFFGVKEIIVLNHTECGMMLAPGDYLTQTLAQKMDIGSEPLNPAVPELKLDDPLTSFPKWIQMFTDVDATCEQQVALLQNSQFIPKDVKIHGYVWEVESNRLRRPNALLNTKVNTSQEMGVCQTCSKYNCLHHHSESKCGCLA